MSSARSSQAARVGLTSRGCAPLAAGARRHPAAAVGMACAGCAPAAGARGGTYGDRGGKENMRVLWHCYKKYSTARQAGPHNPAWGGAGSSRPVVGAPAQQHAQQEECVVAVVEILAPLPVQSIPQLRDL
jgi:hypothetical protein